MSVAFLQALEKSEDYFEKKEREWAESKANFLHNVENVFVKARDVEHLVNQTRVKFTYGSYRLRFT